MKTLVLRKRKWARGGKNGTVRTEYGVDNDVLSALLTDSGRMCCLGFLGKKCGATDEQIAGECLPADAPGVRWPSGLVLRCSGNRVVSTELADEIATVNDDYKIGDAKRVSKLRLLFRKLGYRLVVKP